MAATTILATTQTGVSAYSSGPLDVGGVTELLLDFHVTAGSGGTPDVHEDWNPVTDEYNVTFILSRLDAFGNVFAFNRGTITSRYTAGDTPVYPEDFLFFLLPSGFGTRIQIDMDNPNGLDVDFTLSIIGK